MSTVALSPAPVSAQVEVRALALTGEELAFIERVAPFTGRTPRRALRFLNTYRVIKASLGATEVARLESGGYRSLMVQLAIVTGSPGMRRVWSSALNATHTPADLATIPQRLKTSGAPLPADDLPLGSLSALTDSAPGTLDLVTDLKRYGELAHRYSFESGPT